MVYQVLNGEGSPLDAHFEVAGRDIIFHSRGGKKNTPTIRNQDYGPALRLVLERLAGAGAAVSGVWVDTARTASLSEDQRLVLYGQDLKRPPAEQFTILSEAMRLVGRKKGGPYGGSTTKRIRIRVVGPTGQTLPAVVGAVWTGPVSAVEKPPEPLQLLGELDAIDGAMHEWLSALREGSRAISTTRRWLPEEAVMFATRPSTRRATAVDLELGVRASGEPWTLQLNAPRRAADANSLTTVAVGKNGARYLIRQGRLQANPDSDGLIMGQAFRQGSGLSPVPVADQTTPQPREWFVVADLETSPAEIRRRTAEFVHACARARAASLGHTLADATTTTGGDEKGGFFIKKAVPAKPEQEVRRIQGEIWLALRRHLEAANIVMNKPRHDAGYEVDGVIHAPGGPILLEIKTGMSAANIYEGLGQLMIYPRLMKLSGHHPVLLLPGKAPPQLLEAVESCGIEIHHYDDRSTADAVDIGFPEAFLKLCTGCA